MRFATARLLRTTLVASLLVGSCLVGPARADDTEVLRRLEALAAAFDRVEEAARSLVTRLDRIDRRLSEIEARLDHIEKSGLASSGTDAHGEADGPPKEAPPVTVPALRLMNKRIEVLAESGDEYLRVDVEGTLKDLTKAARIKGRFLLLDRFDAVKKTYDVTTEVLRPGSRLILKGVSFRLTRTAEEDLWLRTVDVRELRGRFEVLEVVYGVDVQDAPRRE